MEVILLEKVAQLGDPGDLVNVKSGYGRTFLIPTGKAVRADEENKAEYEKRKEALLSAEAERKDLAMNLASGMESLVIEITAEVSEEGTLYGSVGTREIADVLVEKTSAVHFLRFQLDAKDIEQFKKSKNIVFGIDHKEYNFETKVDDKTMESLSHDFD